jgi:RNA polymerase sigma-70 factor (ECF subfamily)
MHQLALRYTRNQEDAEEVVQDVLLKVRDKIDAFRGDAALSSWIYRITFNTAMSRLRSTRSTRWHEVPDEPLGLHDEPSRAMEPADWSNLGDELVHRRQMRDALRIAVAELPAIYREPVILRDLRGLSTEEASRRLNVKDQTLKSRLHRGRLILRDRLAHFAGGLSLHDAATAH